MTDEKSRQDERDPPVAVGKDYGTRYLAERPSTTTDQVRELIKRHPNDRETFIKDARKPK